MTDKQVLAMPVYRFWSMEYQIDRIRSENDMRQLSVNQGTLSSEAMQSTVKRLTIEMGDRCKVEHNAVVKSEEGAAAKFASVMG